MSTLRMQRVSELIKQEVSAIISRDIVSENVGMITVTGCEVASDLKTARVYISVIGDAGKQAAALALVERHQGHIQRALGRAVVLKYIPHLTFYIDESIERADRIEKILNEIEREKPSGES
ncbi:MAG: 30S ribosome-binding factor RbfA [Verrucomicrobiia bacterium]